jgi:hypothetical protein
VAIDPGGRQLLQHPDGVGKSMKVGGPGGHMGKLAQLTM